MKKPNRRPESGALSMGAPFLRGVTSLPEKCDPTRYPFNIPALSRGIDLAFRTQVTFLAGENGSGKSTLLEALAECCGFSPEGGNWDHHREVLAERSGLAQALRLSWLPKVTEGFFMRAESFYNFATYIEQVSDMRAYGGKSLHHQSHGIMQAEVRPGTDWKTRLCLAAALVIASCALCACDPQPKSTLPLLRPVVVSGESGLVDLKFRIFRTQALALPDGTRATGIEFGAVFEGKPITLGLTVLREWKKPSALPVWTGTVSVLCMGPTSDALVQALAKFYKVPAVPTKCGGTVIAHAISLGVDPTNLDEQPVHLKVFFEGASQDDHGEIYLNLDLRHGFVEMNEKDPAFRRAVIKALGDR